MVQSKKQTASKPKFAEVDIDDNEAKEMRETITSRSRRNPYFKLNYPNGVTLVLPADINIDQLRAYNGDMWRHRGTEGRKGYSTAKPV